MLKRCLCGLLWGVVGYCLGAVGGVFLVYAFSPNLHDRDLEAVMTGAFFSGPLLAALFFLAALVLAGRRSRKPPSSPSPGQPDSDSP